MPKQMPKQMPKYVNDMASNGSNNEGRRASRPIQHDDTNGTPDLTTNVNTTIEQQHPEGQQPETTEAMDPSTQPSSHKRRPATLRLVQKQVKKDTDASPAQSSAKSTSSRPGSSKRKRADSLRAESLKRSRPNTPDRPRPVTRSQTRQQEEQQQAQPADPVPAGEAPDNDDQHDAANQSENQPAPAEAGNTTEGEQEEFNYRQGLTQEQINERMRDWNAYHQSVKAAKQEKHAAEEKATMDALLDLENSPQPNENECGHRRDGGGKGRGCNTHAPFDWICDMCGRLVCGVHCRWCTVGNKPTGASRNRNVPGNRNGTH